MQSRSYPQIEKADRGRCFDPAVPASDSAALPLSWTRSALAAPRYRVRPLAMSGYRWICLAELPERWTFEEAIGDLENGSNQALVIRGCSGPLTRQLADRGWDILQTGVEAVLSLNAGHFRRASLRALVRRGNRHGRSLELSATAANLRQFQEFCGGTVHAGKPQLRDLFRHFPEPGMRCFVFCSRQQRWLGAVTLSKVAEGHWHAEQILRSPAAPVGTMEALCAAVFATLKDEGAHLWSLGEVPFQGVSEKHSGLNKSFVRAGKTFNFAYNAGGLFSFKSKFDPSWQPLYLVSNRRITWSVLWDLFNASGYRSLVQAQIGRRALQRYRHHSNDYQTRECA